MPALAIAEAVRRDHPDWRIVLVGASRGIEATLLPTRGFPFELLSAEPIYRRHWWKNLKWPWLAIRLLREVDGVLDRERPAAVIGTGGYAAGPLVWRAARRGIPTAIQEQNAHPGITTRWLLRWVREVWLGVPEAGRQLRGRGRAVIRETGNPIVPPDPARRVPALARFGFDPARPVVLVTGGSQGALALNETVAEWLGAGGATGCQVLWATGRGTWERFRTWHRPPEVHVIEFIDPMADAYAVATLAVARGGMMTIAEFCAWGIPSIIIPLPTAAADHQTHNARVLAEAGAAIHLNQAELGASRLGDLVCGLLNDADRLARMGAQARSRGRPEAASRISALVGVLSG